jgi:hypothetical protein
MSVGPAQSIEDAGRASLEMAYSLTPDIETSAGEQVSMKAEPDDGMAQAGTGGTDEEQRKVAARRLENAGPAVRPEFGRGLRLYPRVVTPDTKVVVLRMSEIDGEGFGDAPEGRALRLNRVELPILPGGWKRNSIAFEVPANATSGVVTLECGQLAGQPFLTVSRVPKARIAVKVRAGSNRVGFDSRRSSDDGEIVSREWRVSGLARGNGAEQLSRALPPRDAVYKVRLTVTDDDGETGVAEVRLLRLRAPFFGFDEPAPESKRAVAHVRRALALAAAEGGAPARIEIDGHADDPGTWRYNMELSWRRVLDLESRLRSSAAAATWDDAVPSPRLTLRGFGESCPIVPGGGRLRKNRRVEVFILGPGTRLIMPHGCHAGRVRRIPWKLPAE